jgi:hypothetical protein
MATGPPLINPIAKILHRKRNHQLSSSSEEMSCEPTCKWSPTKLGGWQTEQEWRRTRSFSNEPLIHHLQFAGIRSLVIGFWSLFHTSSCCFFPIFAKAAPSFRLPEPENSSAVSIIDRCGCFAERSFISIVPITIEQFPLCCRTLDGSVD